jgi:SAM-dependent methyltransferase
MRRPFDPGAPDPRIGALLGEIPPEILEERTWFASELFERYASELAVDVAAELGLDTELVRGATADEILERRGFVAEFRPALCSLLARLAADGEIEASGQPARYRRNDGLRASDRQEIRRAGVARDASLEPSLALLDAAVAIYPAVAAGETTGDLALLAPAKVGLWLGYFDNANPVYSLSNSIAAVAAANRLPSSGPFTILELGAGAGSAAEALLDELARRDRLADLELYELTEPSPFFRRRAERLLRQRFPGVRFDSKALDIDLPFRAQGASSRYDLIYGVNVLHVARRLAATLGEILGALVPGGALVAGECLRLFPGQPVPADLVFELFRGFTAVETDPSTRPHHGFLEFDVWRRTLVAAGFDTVAIVPDLERIREVCPRFFAGALCGRRPAAGVPLVPIE